MSKVICPCVECVYNGKRYICNSDKVELRWRNIATVNEGRVDMWVCKQYELSDYGKKIADTFMSKAESEVQDAGCR